jgi:hypothetical protein
MKIKALRNASVICFILLCSCNGATKYVIDKHVYWLPKCKEIVKYSSNMFTVKGVEIPISSVPVKIGEVTWQPQVLQTAKDITQILDLNRMATCQNLPAQASAGPDHFQRAITIMQEDETRLTQLSLLVAANNPDAVKKWIDAYAGRAVAVAGATGEATKSVGISIGGSKLPKTLEGIAPDHRAALVPLETLWK